MSQADQPAARPLGTPEPSPASDPGADPRRDRIAESFGMDYDEVTAEGRPGLRARFRPGYRVVGTDGSLDVGALLGSADILGGVTSGLAVLPDWVVTTSIAARIDRTDSTGAVHATTRVLGVSGRTAVAVVQFTDTASARVHGVPDVTGNAARADGAVGEPGASLAEVLVSSAIRRPHGLDLGFTRPLHRQVAAAPDTDDVIDAFGLHPVDRRTMALELLPHLRNPWGILHGGAMSVLVDRAARHAVAGTCRSFLVHFLAPTTTGPAHARADVLGRGPAGTVVRVAVHDMGADAALVALATAVVV